MLKKVLSFYPKSTIVFIKKYYRFSKKLILLCQKDYNLQRKKQYRSLFIVLFHNRSGSIVNNQCLVITFLAFPFISLNS